MEPGTAQENEVNYTTTAVQVVIADEVKSQVANPLAATVELVKEAVEQLFRAITNNAQCGVHTVVYDALKHVICDRIRTAALGETIEEHMGKYFKNAKAAGALGKGSSGTWISLAAIASFVQMKIMDAIEDQCSVDVFGSTSIATCAK